MKNTYVFDYNVIAKLDPSYRQYLMDINQYDEEENVHRRINQIVQRAVDTIEPDDNPAFTKDDRDIINLVSNTNSNVSTSTPRDRYNFEEIETPEIPETLILKPELEYHEPTDQKMCPPQFQLCPPKNVLGPGSRIYEDKKVYTMTACGVGTNPDTVILHKKSISISGDKIRYVRVSYWFDRVRNITSEQSPQNKMLTYNKKTRNLYKIYKVKSGTKNRYKYVIHGVLMNYMLCAAHISGDNYIVRKFVEEIEKAVKCDVPDVYTPLLSYEMTSNWAYPVELLVLQHKLGKRVDWIDQALYIKASAILHNKFFLTKDGLVSESDHDLLNKVHRSKIRKFIPHLRKYTNYTSLIESIFGKLYTKILLKLMPYDPDIIVYTHIASHINEKSMPKTIHHLLHAIINSDLDNSNKRHALGSIYNALNDTAEGRPDITDKWAVTALRFIKKGQPPPTVYMWRDMYNMAERYHVRVRPRKFNDLDDVLQFHTHLVAIQTRDRQVLVKYKHKNFLTFDAPSKLYSGFQFKFIGTPAALVEEGVVMHHCVGGYVDRCLSGHSLIFSMRKDDVGYVTIELNGGTYQVRQQYTIGDSLVNNSDICGIINAWQRDVVKMHKDDKESYYELCNPSNKPLINDDSAATPIDNPDGMDWLCGIEPTAVAF